MEREEKVTNLENLEIFKSYAPMCKCSIPGTVIYICQKIDCNGSSHAKNTLFCEECLSRGEIKCEFPLIRISKVLLNIYDKIKDAKTLRE